jgi:SAM-dependent methyltransferase
VPKLPGMAQQIVVDLVAELSRDGRLPDPVVEFGALQVEPGQPNDLRPLFAGRDYVGTDMRTGPGVDRVEDLRGLTFAEGEVGTALCLDTLEHCEDPLTACRELHRVLAPGGVCVISSVMLFPIHGYPQDFWRFTPEGFRVLLRPFAEVWVGAVGHPELPMQVMGIGIKHGGPPAGLAERRFTAVERAQADWERPVGRVRVSVLSVPVREYAAAAVRELPRATWQRVRARVLRNSA